MAHLKRKTIENAIQEQMGIRVRLYAGDGYFYFDSDDVETSDILHQKYTASVYVYRLNHLSLTQWVDAFRGIWEGGDCGGAIMGDQC